MNTKKPLLIVVDPGFSGLKIIVDKYPYYIPSDIVDVTNDMSEFETMNDIQEYMIMSECISERKFIVGKQAQMMKADGKYQANFDRKKGTMESEERFTTDDFKAQLLTAIAYGLVKYSKEKDITLDPSDTSGYDIFIAVPMPHEFYKSHFSTVKYAVEGEHDFNIMIGKENVHINFTINSGRTICFSQTMCILLSEAMDDEGNIIPERAHFYEDLPALILDGGYGTFGIVEISRGYRIAAENQESNTEYAMHKVNEKIASIANETAKNNPDEIREFNLEDIFKSGDTKVKYFTEENGKKVIKNIDLMEIREKVIADTCENLNEYIDNTHNLLKIKQVIIGGGTGYAYAEHLKIFLEEERDLKGYVHLTDNTLGGKKIDPVFAVAAGMYKFAIHKVNEIYNS